MRCIYADDYFAEGWPGVSEGVQKFLRGQEEGSGRLVPFFVGFNKVRRTGMQDAVKVKIRVE